MPVRCFKSGSGLSPWQFKQAVATCRRRFEVSSHESPRTNQLYNRNCRPTDVANGPAFIPRLLVPVVVNGYQRALMSKTDVLKQYASLREALIKEKTQLQAQIAAIEEALGSVESAQLPVRRAYTRRAPTGTVASGSRRRRNSSPLKQLVLEATKAKPMKREEILEAVIKLGYKFAAKNPLASLTTILYSAKEFKRYERGVFGPA